MKSKVLFLTVMLASAGAFAADAAVKTVSYTYGMDLDVAEVVSIEETPHGRCEPVDAKMTYRDSHGDVHSISYVKQDAYCD